MKVYGVIYIIWNMKNGKKYVGQTVQSLKKRMAQHKCGCLCVDKAIQKYGWKNFRYGILEKCDTSEQLNEREKYWIAALRCKSPNGYNCTDGGDRDFTVSPETHAKLSVAKSGKNNPNYGKPLSNEHRKKISESHKGENNPNFGKHCSDETRKKMSASRKGKKRSAETKTKISTSHKGEIFTEERCANISKARRGKTPFKNLSNAIAERKLSYRKLAILLGITHSALSMKMTGKRNFTTDDIAKLVNIFSKPAKYLMQCVED